MDPELAALGEFGLIALIRRRVRQRSPGTVLGIGDDAAVLATGSGHPLLVTTDMLLEGVHFRREWGRPRELGRKAMAVNLSDIAAMGGSPLYALWGLAIPPEGSALAEIEALVDGLEEEAEASGVTLVGGDTCASQSGLVLALTLVGTLPKGRAVLRSGAKPGDGLWVTGRLGGSAAGLLALQRGLRPGRSWPSDASRPGWFGAEEEEAIQAALRAHLTPVARLAAGQALVGCATAMIDISDGLAADAGHLCAESGVTAHVVANQIPVHPGAHVMARLTGGDALHLALRGGEDYELLFAAPADPGPLLAEVVPDLTVTWIGEVAAGPAPPTLRYADGREEILVGGFDHLRGSARRHGGDS